MTRRNTTTIAPMTTKAMSGLGADGSRRSLTTRMQTPMMSRRTMGLVVRDAAVASPSPHSHQAAGCRSRSRALMATGSGVALACGARARDEEGGNPQQSASPTMTYAAVLVPLDVSSAGALTGAALGPSASVVGALVVEAVGARSGRACPPPWPPR